MRGMNVGPLTNPACSHGEIRMVSALCCISRVWLRLVRAGGLVPDGRTIHQSVLVTKEI